VFPLDLKVSAQPGAAKGGFERSAKPLSRGTDSAASLSAIDRESGIGADWSKKTHPPM
jgi:hypothetical protein